MKRNKEKFAFGVDFQESILQYTVNDRKGYQLISLYEDTYFSLLPHQFVAFALKRYYKKKKRIPGHVVLKENLRQLYQHKDYAQYTTEDFRKEVDEVVDRIFRGLPRDGEDLRDEVIKFAQYVELKHELETADVTDFSNYSNIHKKIQKAISIGKNLDGRKGIRIVGDAEARTSNREVEKDTFHTPYWQLNRSQNSGGILKASLIMFMSQAKRFKTGTMLNFAKACMGRRKKGLYIDLENGEEALTMRMDQSITGAPKKSVQVGEQDPKLLKQLRKYRRLGSELVIRRLPGGSTCADIQAIMDEYKLDDGLVFDFVVVDYGDLLGALSGKTDDTERISDAYLDMKNLALHNNLDFIATASHVKREANKRRATKYQAEDVAKCIDKIRHLDICIGLQETEAELESGVMRWEVIDQRDGPPEFTMYFWVDIEKQRLKEFTRNEVKALNDQVANIEGRREASKDV